MQVASLTPLTSTIHPHPEACQGNETLSCLATHFLIYLLVENWGLKAAGMVAVGCDVGRARLCGLGGPEVLCFLAVELVLVTSVRSLK